MFDWLNDLFSPDGFVRRKDCGAWTPEWIAVHTGSDVLIWLAYLSIPLVLLSAARHPAARPVRPLLWLFAAFIVSCGTVHLIEAVIFEHPVYRLSGVAKGVTALVSWATVFALIPTVRRLRPLLDRVEPPPVTLSRPARNRRVLVYVLAVLVGLLAVVIRLVLDPVLRDLPAFGVCVLAVIFVAWYGGYGPGLVTLIECGLLTVFLFIPPRQSLMIMGVNHQVDVGLYLVTGLGVLLLGELQRATRRRQEAQMTQLAAVTSALATEKLATDRALAQLDALVRNAPYSIAFLDHELRPVRVNETFARASRIAVEDHYGRRLPELLPDIPSDLLAKYQEVLAGGPPVVGRLVFGGGRVWEVSAFQVPIDADHAGLGVIGQDVTERHRAEERVRESEARFRQLAEVMPQIVWVARADGSREYYNSRWTEFTGMSEEETLGVDRWVAALHPDDQERGRAAWARSVETGEPYQVEYRFRRRDGAYEWFLGRAVAVRDEAGQIVRWLGTCTGIDEQVRTAQALAENEAYIRGVLDNSPDCIKVLDPAGRLIEFNAPGLVAMGIDNFTHLRGQAWPGLWPAESQERVRQAVATAAGGRVDRFSGWSPTMKGEAKFWDVMVAPIPDASGRVVRLVGVSRDVTAQKRVEDELREAKRFSENILNSLSAHLVVIDADGQILTVNESWRQFGEANGIPADYDWTSDNYFNTGEADEHAQRSAVGIRAVARGERGAFEMEYPCHGVGRNRWFVMRVNRFRGDGPVRLVVTHENITDRVLAERRVREQASELLQLTEGLPVLMWACQPTGECDYLSRQWVEYTGRPADAQLGFAWLDAIHPEDRSDTQAAWQAAVTRGDGYNVEFRIRRHDEVYRWFAVRGFPVRDQTGQVVRWYGSCTDIHDRVRQELILEQLVEERTAELVRSNVELEKFAYVASHDLQEPLRKIQAFGDRLRDKFRPSLGDLGKDYIDRMLDSAGRMRRLIDDLLTFSRVTSKASPFGPISLIDLVRDVLEDLDDRLTRSGGRVATEGLPTVSGDPSQLRQVFQNLIGNALKFAHPQTPPEVRVVAVAFDDVRDSDSPPPDGPGWRITVSDNGIGFEQEYAERIFELFQRLHGRKEFEGTGLGLAIVRKILLRHGATITAIGRPGVGAEFRIDWPTTVTEAAHAPS